MIGEVLDHYRVLELVGRGAMGVVYKALDVNLDRTVAIKVMSAEARTDPDFVERFRQEARAQGALNHPNVALLFDYFVHDGAPVAVMEFIDGESLEQLIRRRGAIPVREAIPLFKQALRGVAAAHRAGIIHRDLKPGNLMVTKDDIVKVMDFGIAKRQGVTGATKVSTSIGSPLYMAPEQILGRAVDCRTDVYALGITLYELLTGVRPFNARGKAEYLVLDAHVNDQPEPPTVYRRGIPPPIVDAVMRALAKEPDARFQSAEDFMRALPDVPAPDAAAPPLGPTVTVAEENAPLMSAPSVASRKPTGTVALEYSPSMSESATRKRTGTIVLGHAPTVRIDPPDSMAFDYSAETLRLQQLHRDRSDPASAVAPPAAAEHGVAAAAGRPVATLSINPRQDRGLSGTPPGFMHFLRAHRLSIAAALVATVVLGLLARHPQRLAATLPGASLDSSGPRFTEARASTATQTPLSTELAPPPAGPSSGTEPAAALPADVTTTTTAAPPTAMPPAATTLATTSAPVRQDLSGTWRGEYVDASGKQRLRVVNLSISRVRGDGGIEGTLQYEAASGGGECQLHSRRSTYSADEQRLQLSPEGCSPHYPKELGVPLDFDRVNPRANVLKDGRIEAPTGEVIRVRLKRVTGV